METAYFHGFGFLWSQSIENIGPLHVCPPTSILKAIHPNTLLLSLSILAFSLVNFGVIVVNTTFQILVTSGHQF